MFCDNILAMKEKSVNKFRANMEAIIEKYSQPYDESKEDIIDLETLTICCDRGQLRSKSYKPRPFGKTRLTVEDHIELDMTICTEKCTFNASRFNCSTYEQSMSLAPEAHFPNESMQQSLLPCDTHNSHSVLCHSMHGEPEPSDAETLSDESGSDGWETEDETCNRKRYGSFSDESSSDAFVVEKPSSEKLSGQISKQENCDTVEQSKVSSCSPGCKNTASVKSTPAEQLGFNLKHYIRLLKGNSSSKKDSGSAITACISSVSKWDPSKRDLFNSVANTATHSQVNLLNSAKQHKEDEQNCLSLNQNRKPASQEYNGAVFSPTGIRSGHSTDTKMGESAANHMSVQDMRFKDATKKLLFTSHEEFSREESRIERRHRERCSNSPAFSPVASVISPAYKRASNLCSSKNATIDTTASPQSQVIRTKPFESKSIREIYFRVKSNVSCSSPSNVSTLPDDSNVSFPGRPTNKCGRVSSECAEDTITGSIVMLSLASPGVPNTVSSDKPRTRNQEKASHGCTSVAVNDVKYNTSSQLAKVARQTSRRVKPDYLGMTKNTLPATEGPCRIKTGISSNSSLSPSELLSNLNLGSPNDFGSKSERQLQNVKKSRNRKHSESAKTKGVVDFDKNANSVKPGFVRKLQFCSNNYGKNSNERTRQKTTTSNSGLSDILNKRIENTVICSDRSKVDESFNPTRSDTRSFRVPARFPLLDTRDDASVEDDEDCFVDLLNLTDEENEDIGKSKSEIDETSSDNGLILVGTTSTPTKDMHGAVFEASFISSISESSEITRIKEIAMKAVDETICSVSSIDCASVSTEEDKISANGFEMPSSENLMRDDAVLSQLSDDNKTLVSVPAKPYSMISNDTYLISTPEKISSVPAKFICSLRLEKLAPIPRHFSVDGKAKMGLKSVELKSQSGILNSYQTRLSNFQKPRSDNVSFEQKRRATKRQRSSSSSSSDVEKKTLASNVNSELIGTKPMKLPRSMHIVYNTRQNASPGSYKNVVRVCNCYSNTK